MAAALAVVLLHVAAEPVALLPDTRLLGWHVGNALDSATRWCIGVFVMVSGALLLDPARSESVRDFYAKRLRRILVPIVFWSAVYLALRQATGPPPGWTEVASDLWHGRPGYHMWYLFMVLGLYAVTPWLRSALGRLDRTQRWAAIALLFGAAALYELGAAFRGWPAPDVVPLMFLPYLGYYLCGRELRSVRPGVRTRVLASAVVVAAVGVTAIGTRRLIEAHGVTHAGLFMYSYLSPNVIAMSIAVFLLGAGRGTRDGADSALTRFVARIAPLTLGIYLAHPMLIEGMRRLGIQATDDPLLGVVSVALAAFALSAALCHGMSRVKGLRQCIGLG